MSTIIINFTVTYKKAFNIGPDGFSYPFIRGFETFEQAAVFAAEKQLEGATDMKVELRS